MLLTKEGWQPAQSVKILTGANDGIFMVSKLTEKHKYLISDANSTILPHKLIGLFQKLLWKLNNATITLFKKEQFYQNFPQLS